MPTQTMFFGGIYIKILLYFNSFYHTKCMNLRGLETALSSSNHRLMYAISKNLLSFLIISAECFKLLKSVFMNHHENIKSNIIAANNSA
jgi:hypothetical protein